MKEQIHSGGIALKCDAEDAAIAAALHDEADGCVVCTSVGKDTGKPESPVPVEVGISDGERVEILSGLTEGQTVWYTIYDTPEYSVPGAGGAAI